MSLPLLPHARLDLQGTCNRCGACCVVEEGGHRLVCEYLKAEVPVQPLGAPMASRCGAYEYRSHLRPIQIRMRDAHGTVRLVGQCFKDTWQEDHAIVERGMGRGCSLTLPVSQGQLVSFEPATR